MLAPGAILDEAHDQAIALIGIDHDGGDGVLLQFDEGFEPSLTADEIVLRRLLARTPG
jgi:hypothetical protein